MATKKQFTLDLGDQTLIVDTGLLAQQASGSCMLRVGDTQVLGTCAISKEARSGVNFLPLMVNYNEKYYAGGIIGGVRYHHREGRPPVTKLLMARLIDRGLRPTLPKYLRRDIQVMLNVMSYDKENSHDMVSANAASLAVAISECPFDGPLGTVRVGMIDGELVLNPTVDAQEKSDLNLVVTSNLQDVVMIEVGANEIPEDKLLEAILFGKKWCQKIAQFFKTIQSEIGKDKFIVDDIVYDEEVTQIVKDNYGSKIEETLYSGLSKVERYNVFYKVKKEAAELIIEKLQDEEKAKDVSPIIDSLVKNIVRKNILESDKRIAGRKLDEIRPLACEVDLLARTHGSALFQRGETQALSVTTLGGPGDHLVVDGMEGESTQYYFHHYNFPPFSVGEVSNRLATGNREWGHGALAEKALVPVLPSHEDFPYTIRVVSEILESNGSSSMAATCGSTLSLMAAGVPIKSPVAGVAMGMMSDSNNNVFKILTDLQDEEDFGGDMDFKVTGTAQGVTALQMDIKVKGLPDEVMKEALEKAKKGRMFIMDAMLKSLPEYRKDLNKFAPRLYTIKIDQAQIKIVIGKGGETINKIIAETGVDIDIGQDGNIVITSVDAENANKAVEWIKQITAKPEVGKIYEGKVTKMFDFGALVEIIPGIEGMVHISMLKNERVNKVTDVINLGDVVKVKLLEVDANNKMRLSMKDVPLA